MQPADRSSSMLRRSLPQPPQSVSFGSLHGVAAGRIVASGRAWFVLVPPTSQSLPRSPKIESLPSLYFVPVARHVPLDARLMQPGSVSRPTIPVGTFGFESLTSKFMKYWYGNWLIGELPVQIWPLGVKVVQPHVEPVGSNRIARRGSYSL